MKEASNENIVFVVEERYEFAPDLSRAVFSAGSDRPDAAARIRAAKETDCLIFEEGRLERNMHAHHFLAD